jgi:hypothetical protein
MNSQPIVEIKSYTGEDLMDIDKWKPLCMDAARTKQEPKFKAINFVVEFEEKELHELKDPESPLYSFFHQRFQRIANEANVNLFIFIGHSDICLDYVDLINKRLQNNNLRIPNSLPSVILVIGCLGEGYLSKYLREKNGKYKNLHRRNFHFFGFQNLVHIYKGKIFNCQQPHLALPKLRCDHLPADKHEECCGAKQGSFQRLFLDSLNKRNCTEISDEAFIERFRSIGSPTFKGYLFGTQDGKNCKETDPCITPTQNLINNNTKSKQINELSKNFDAAWLDLYLQIDDLSEKDTINLYKNLPKEKAFLLSYQFQLKRMDDVNGYLYTFDHNNNTLLAKAIEQDKYEVAMYLLSQTKIPVSLRKEDINSIIFYIRKQGIVNDPFQDLPSGENDEEDEETPRLPAWQYYNYFVLALKKDPAFFTTLYPHPDYPEIETTCFYELLNCKYGFKISFVYTNLRDKVPLNENGYVDFTQLITEKKSENFLSFRFPQVTEKNKEYYHIIWCLAMKMDPNASGIKNEIKMYLDYILNDAVLQDDNRLILIQYLLAFGYKEPSVLQTISTIYKETNDFMNRYPNASNNPRYNYLYEKRYFLQSCLQLVQGSELFDRQLQQDLKYQANLEVEMFVYTTETKFKFRDNIPSRQQFPAMMAMLSQYLKRKPALVREVAYDVANEIIQNGKDPEYIRLGKLREHLERFKPAPVPNTTVKAKPKPARVLNPENNNAPNAPVEPPARRRVVNPENNNNQGGGKRRKTRKNKK